MIDHPSVWGVRREWTGYNRGMKETMRSRTQTAPVKTVAGFLMALAILASQIVVIPTASSSFRLSKSVVVLAIIACAAVVWFVTQAFTGGVRIVRSPLIGVVAVYPVLVAVSALWAPEPAKTLVTAGEAAIWILGVIVMAGLSEIELGRVRWWAIVGGALSAAVAVAQTAGVSPFQLSGVKGRLKIIGLAGNPSDLAAASILLLPFLFTGTDRARRVWLRIAAGAVLTAGVLVSQSRAGLLAFVIEVLVLLGWLASRHASKRTVIVGAVIAAVLFGAGIWVNIPRFQWTVQTIRHQGLLSAINRDGGWTAAAVMIGEHPVLGTGGGSFSCRFAAARLKYLKAHDRVGYKRIGFASHFPNAHDDPLQVIAELGIIGLVWMIVLCVVLVRTKPWRDLPLALALAGLIPFLIFQYPCHLAVTLAPMMVLMVMIVHQQGDGPSPPIVFRRSRWFLLLAVFLLAVVTIWVEVRTLQLDIWRKNAEMTIQLVRLRTRQGRLPEKARTALLGGLDMEGTARLGRVPGADPWLWRIIGLSRLGRGDATGAETAFRKSLRLCPHEEGYLGLGIALLDQGRINEAFQWLTDACRIDPNLAKVIPDSTFRRTVVQSISGR